MFHMLQVVDADIITTGDEEEPALDYRDYKKRAAKAASTISLSCSSEFLIYIATKREHCTHHHFITPYSPSAYST